MSGDECDECGAYLRAGQCFECRDAARRCEGDDVEALIDLADLMSDRVNEVAA